MIQLLAFAGLLFANRFADEDSALVSQPLPQPDQQEVASTFHVVASAYGSIGSYSTDTRSRSGSAYLTYSDAWKNYYTLGFANLWLVRDDLGGRYYTQELVSGRASWLLGYRTNLFASYAYLHEGEITSFSSAATFHFAGGGASYWLTPTEQIGMSSIMSLSKGKVQSENLRGFFSFHIVAGIWATSTSTFSKADWTPSLFVFRQLVSVPLWADNFLVMSADFGRHAFYFDDELLVVYNQRDIQVGSYLVKGTIRLFDQVYAIPSIEYNKFDAYNVAYGSIGFKVVY